VGVVTKRYKEETMVDSGLAMRLDRLFAKWPQLLELNQATAELWDRRVQDLQNNKTRKHLIVFVIVPENRNHEILLDALQNILEDQWGCQMLTGREQHYGQSIIENTRYHLGQADIFIAEVSESADQDVMVTIGAALIGFSHVPMVLLCQQENPQLPKNLQGLRVVSYTEADCNLIEELENRLSRIEPLYQILENPRENFLSISRLHKITGLNLERQNLRRLHKHYPTEESWKLASIKEVRSLLRRQENLAELLLDRLSSLKVSEQELEHSSPTNQEITNILKRQFKYPKMSHFQSIYEEAQVLHRRGRFYDAAVMFMHSHNIAEENGMKPESSTAVVWAAISWAEASNPFTSYSLLIDITRFENTSEDRLALNERWLAKKYVLKISSSHFPELETIQKRLASLKQFQKDYPELPLSDCYELAGDLLSFQGQWQAALREYELAWVQSNDSDCAKYEKANKAAYCNLHLGKLSVANHWCSLIGESNTHGSVNNIISDIGWCTLQANFALYAGDYTQAEIDATEAEEIQEMVQYGAGGPFTIHVRTLLLQMDLGDPAAPNHPARFQLRQRFHRQPNVFEIYDRILLLADYRLACVRYTLGIFPVDDFWYQQPQQYPTDLPPNFQLQNFKRRVQVAHRAIRRALEQAAKTDSYFQCHWRQEIVQQRQTRLDEIVNMMRLHGGFPC
jgi:hypothetical protein